jgi:hypothetical protein
MQWNVGKVASAAAIVSSERFVGHLVQITPKPSAQTLKRLAIRHQLVSLEHACH